MLQDTYCYKLGQKIAMLTDEEFEQVRPHLGTIELIRRYRAETGCSLLQAKTHVESNFDEMSQKSEAMATYEKLTGQRLNSMDERYLARLSDYGRPCPPCGKPFRSRRARFFAECGFKLPEGETAGVMPPPGGLRPTD